VQGDSRTYTPPAVVTGPQDWERLDALSTSITNAVRAVNRVVTLVAPAAGLPAPDSERPALPALEPHPAFCTKERLDLLRDADAILTAAIDRAGLTREVFQTLTILLPLGTREEGAGAGTPSSGECVVLRPVVSEDVMTARFARLPWDVVNAVAAELMRLPGIRAVFYDVTHKPPATFGWE
jgi:GMP synthase (glutamine-hydrolysing)